MNSIEISNLSYGYRNQSNTIFKSINLNIFGNKTVGIIGINGCGKTTLLRLIAGLIKQSAGKIIINGKEVKKISDTSKQMLYIPENSKLFLLGPTIDDELLRVFKTEELIEKFLGRFNLNTLRYKKLYHLSEGQRRLIAILLAFYFDRNFYLFDEPTIAFDKKGRSFFLESLNKAKAKKRSVIIATNDSRILPYLDILIFIRNDQSVLIGKSSEILDNLEENSELIPNQTVRVIRELRKEGISIPKICTIEDFNLYLGGEK